jgi:hypothetical protein
MADQHCLIASETAILIVALNLPSQVCPVGFIFIIYLLIYEIAIYPKPFKDICHSYYAFLSF